MTMQDKEYRQFYRDARNRELLAMQIRAMREKEGWTQENLGALAGMKQERISVLEDADNGSITYKTLARLADAFDVDLIVRFAPYSETEQWVREMVPEQLAVPKFDEDRGIEQAISLGAPQLTPFSEGWYVLGDTIQESSLSRISGATGSTPRMTLDATVTTNYQGEPEQSGVIDLVKWKTERAIAADGEIGQEALALGGYSV